MSNAAKEVAEIINLPADSFAIFGMAVGRPDTTRTSSIRPRPAQPVVLYHNSYQQGRYREYADRYEQACLASEPSKE